MSSHNLTENYKPRIEFNNNFGIGHPENLIYLNSLAKWGMTRIKQSALPYHKKHLGTTDNGKSGKEVLVTLEELKQIIIDSDGISPDGTKIYFGPMACLTQPNKAISLGLMTAEENNRKPSFDRKNSKGKYTKNNLQCTTKGYNLGKGSDDSSSIVTQDVKIKVNNDIEFVIDNCSPQFLAQYTASLAK